MSLLHIIYLAMMSGHGYANNYEIQKLTLDFIARKLIHQLTVFACWDGYEQTSFYRQSTLSKFKLSYIPIPSDTLDMTRILKVNYYALGILLDLECPRSDTVLKQFSKQHLRYNQTYHWLLVSALNAPPTAMLKDLPLTIDTEMTVAVKDGSDYILYDVYNPSYRHGGSLNVTFMGKWNRDNGLSIQLTQYKYRRRGNLAGLAINVSLVITHESTLDLETYITNPINRHFDTMHRYHYALIRHLRDYYNFTINLRRTNSWGYMINGTFNGMLGEMIAGIVDIGGTPLIIKPERIEVAEFTVQTYVAKTCFIFRHPKKSTVRNGFLRPFTKQVWLLTLIVAVLNWVLLWLTARAEMHTRDFKPISSLNTHPASETALITAAAICQQGLTDGPRLYSGHMVVFSLFMWAMLVYQYYSASIVGSLLAESPRYINTLKDLLDSDLAVGMEDIAYSYNHFVVTKDPVTIELYKRKIAPGRDRQRGSYFKLDEGVRKVQKGNFAFHTEVTRAYKIITEEFTQDEICDLAEIALISPQHLGTVTSKHSPFKKMVTYGMRQIIEYGMAERQRDVWQYSRPRCPESHSLNPVQVSIDEFSPALFLLIIGLMTAASFFLGEKYVQWYT